MKAISCVKILVIVLSFAQTAVADGLIYNLPPDGAWVRFRLFQEGEAAFSFPPGTPVPLGLKDSQRLPARANGFLELRSVGKTELAGEACRWIELELDVAGAGSMPDLTTGHAQETIAKRHIILRMLIPEKHLVAGEDPLAHVCRLHFKDGDAESEAIEDENDKQYQVDRFRPIFPAPARQPALTPKQPTDTLDPKIGRVECDKYVFDSRYEGPLARGQRGWWAWQGRHEVWGSKQVPFGVVSLVFTGHSDEWSGERQSSPKASVDGTQRLVLVGAGTGARSALPVPDAVKPRAVGKTADRRPALTGSVLTDLLGQERVQKELGLSQEQIARIRPADEQLTSQSQGQASMEQLTQREEEARQRLQAILSEEQMVRLHRTALLKYGPLYALASRWFAERLRMTPDQRDRVAGIVKAAQEKIRDVTRVRLHNLSSKELPAALPELEKTVRAIREDAAAEALGVLNTGQRDELERLKDAKERP